MKDSRKIFSTRLQELMKENNEMSRTDLSRAVECELRAVINWVNGTYLPRFCSLIRLSDYFKVNLDYLLGLSEDDTFSRGKNKKNFTERLTELMEKDQLSRYALAKCLKIGQSTISKWFSEGRMPETSTLIELSRLFDVSVEYLAGFGS